MLLPLRNVVCAQPSWSRGIIATCAALLLTTACGDDSGSSRSDGGGSSGGDGDSGDGDRHSGDGDSGDGDSGDGDGFTPNDATAVRAPSGFEPADLVDKHGRLRFKPRAITQQGDAFIVAGDCAADMCALRLSAAGEVDTSFGENGLVRIDAGGMASSTPLLSSDGDGAYGVLVHADKVYLAGYAWGILGTTAHALVVARLDQDGELDTTFGSSNSGLRVIDIKANSFESAARFHGLAVDAEGRLIAVGFVEQGASGTDMLRARFTEEGALDTAYPADDKGQVLQRRGMQRGLSLLPSGDGFVLNGGSELARIGQDGNLDESFGTDGYVVVGSELAQGVVTRADGSLLSAGFTRDGSEDESRARLRLLQTNAQGEFDEAFGPAGEVNVDFDLTVVTFEDGTRLSGGFGLVRGISSLADGGLLFYGSMIKGLSSVPTLIRLDENAAQVTSFGEQGLHAANASLPLFSDLNGLEPASLMLVADDTFYVVDSRVDATGSYLSFWSGEL